MVDELDVVIELQEVPIELPGLYLQEEQRHQCERLKGQKSQVSDHQSLKRLGDGSDEMDRSV